MQAVDIEADDRHNYERLMVALEASQGKLDLLIVVCDDRNLQETLIRQYIAELQPQGIAHYRISVERDQPSLRQVLGQLVQQQPDLQQQNPAVVTVQGMDDLLSARLGKSKSEQEQLFGYLQWTREALREFHFPVVIWVNQALVKQLAEKAPDFWSWRGGVFWFGGQTGLPQQVGEVALDSIGKTSVESIEPEIFNLLHLIEQVEQQEGRNAAQLAMLYEQLGKVYAERGNSGSNRQFAIQAYGRTIQLQRKLGEKADLAESLERLGNLYFERRNNVKQALEVYREAIAMYREVGARLGEANVFQELGKLQDDPQLGLDSLNRAQAIYQQMGDQYSQSRNLLFIADRQIQLQDIDAAIQALQQSSTLAAAISYEPFQKYATDKIAELQAPTTS